MYKKAAPVLALAVAGLFAGQAARAQSTWTGAASGSWSDVDRWTGGVPDDAGVDVLINADGPDYTVTLGDALDISVNGLTIDADGAQLVITDGARLGVADTLNIAAGTLSLEGGTVGGTITGSGLLRGGGTLDAVTLGMTLSMDADDDSINVINGLTLTAGGSIDLLSSGNTLTFTGTQTLDGAGQVYFDGEGGLLQALDGTLTIGSGITISSRNGDGTVGGLGVGSIINQGVIQAGAGRVITLDGDWTNQGTLHTNGGTIRLDGTFSIGDIGAIDRSGGGTVEIAGTLNVGGSVFNPHSGNDFVLHGGTISGGLILPAVGTNLVAQAGSIQNSTIVGLVQVTGELAIQNVSFMGGEIRVDGGRLNFGPGTTPGQALALSGTGTVRLLGGEFKDDNADVTVNPGFTVRADDGANTLSFRTLTNNGAISAADGATLQIAGDLTNHGTIALGLGSGLSLADGYTQSGTGTLQMNLGSMSLELPPLLLTHAASLAGTLVVDLADGYTPAEGASFTLLSSTTDIVGQFSTIMLPDIDPGMYWIVSGGDRTITLTAAVPEPAGLSVVVLGGIALLRRRARGRRH